ncbi:hypothetical protein EON63_06235, partial [archaeon]
MYIQIHIDIDIHIHPCTYIYIGEHLHLHQHKDSLYVECEDEGGSERLLSPILLTSHILAHLRRTIIEYIVSHPHILGDVCKHVEFETHTHSHTHTRTHTEKSTPLSSHKHTIDLNEYVKSVVLGVPANYGQPYKEALTEAAKGAGFEEVNMLHPYPYPYLYPYQYPYTGSLHGRVYSGISRIR